MPGPPRIRSGSYISIIRTTCSRYLRVSVRQWNLLSPARGA